MMVWNKTFQPQSFLNESSTQQGRQLVTAALIPSAKLPKKRPAMDLDGDGRSTKCPRMVSYNPSNKVHPKIKTAFVDRVLKQ
eukprot:9006527-Ditylum_brightwellii.AAC.1